MQKSKLKKISLALLACLLFSFGAKAQEPDVKKVVFDHLSDSYTWHITAIGETDVAVYLPVIVRSAGGEWSVFSSSKFHHGTAAYNGFHIAQEGKYKGKIVEKNAAGEEIRPWDFSLTKNALSLLINCTILLLVILPLARWYKGGTMKPVKGFRGAVEMLILSIYDEVIKPCVGEDYRIYAPYLLTVFFFIFVNNLVGLVPFFPGGANVTGNIAITMVLALCTFCVVNFSGTKAYWKEIFWPEVPLWLKVPAPIMPVIEIFGVFTKPFALMIRLFGNIMAGHAVTLGLICLVFITASMGVAVNAGMSVVAVFFTCFITFVECLVAYIQAYVFTLLSAVFIGMARVKHTDHAKQM
ncbi:MAG: F0F1 ATP synthase subunit A [Prevotellaceae bacterium]|jgi:F-type H+-transporting ATPase subunit a|nr:F0F1 ATP synthase subunit A [Prevotellaceae bacterium]